MLKTMRKHARYFYVLFFIVILSFIFWGVGPLDKKTEVTVAEMNKEEISQEEYWLTRWWKLIKQIFEGKEKISQEEYWRTYERARDFYRQIYKGQFDQEMEDKLKLKEVVLNGLIEERVLLNSAREIGLKVTDKELQDAITSDQRFIRDGVFKKDIYLKALQLNRLTPEVFENSVRQQLTIQKMKMLIWSSVDISNYDTGNISQDEKKLNQMRQILLSQKRDKVMKSYIESMKLKLNVKEYKDRIS